MEKYTLVTSNEFKLKEFKRFGLKNLKIEKGKDLKEVDSDPYSVVLYKALEAGENRIVEDTSLFVSGTDIGTNIRWLLENLHTYDGKDAVWKVLLGLNDGEKIIIYEGEIKGKIVKKFDELKGFGFDSLFVPENSDLTLYELEESGQKDNYSARKNAIEDFLKGNFSIEKKINEIPVWNGNYQK